MLKNVYSYSNYKTYLQDRVTLESPRSGFKSRLARAAVCQPAYITQVLKGAAHLSLEQAIRVSDWFEMDPSERHYFLLLVQRARAGSLELQKYFELQISACVKKRNTLSKRLESTASVSEGDRSRYYSSWIYAAIHMALTIPELRTKEAIAKRLGLPERKVMEALGFLCRSGLAKRSASGYELKVSNVRLASESPLMTQHHTNWRLQAVNALERESLRELHYSSVMSLSQKDATRLKEMILEFIGHFLSQVKVSREELIYCMGVDFFEVK